MCLKRPLNLLLLFVRWLSPKRSQTFSLLVLTMEVLPSLTRKEEMRLVKSNQCQRRFWKNHITILSMMSFGAQARLALSAFQFLQMVVFSGGT